MGHGRLVGHEKNCQCDVCAPCQNVQHELWAHSNTNFMYWWDPRSSLNGSFPTSRAVQACHFWRSLKHQLLTPAQEAKQRQCIGTLFHQDHILPFGEGLTRPLTYSIKTHQCCTQNKWNQVDVGVFQNTPKHCVAWIVWSKRDYQVTHRYNLI